MHKNTRKSLVLISVLILLVGCAKQSSFDQANAGPDTPFIVPPIPGVDVPHECFAFEAEKGTLIELLNGTRIVIPPASLVDQDGNPVSGNVELAYREFHDAADILLSGIPMDYDSAGIAHKLETAGMFEIEVSQQGHPVFLGEGNQAQVNMASYASGDDFNFYFLDKENRNWQYNGNRKAEVNFEKVVRKERIKTLKRKRPYLLREGHFVFDYAGLLDIYIQPEYKLMDIPQEDGQPQWRTIRKAYDTHLTNDSTQKVVLRKASQYGLTCLEMTVYDDVKFMNRYLPASLIVWKLLGNPIPSWADTAYRKEITHIEGNIYQLDVTASKGGTYFHTRIQAVMPIKDLFKIPSQQWMQERKEILATIEREEARIQIEADILRSFEIRQFGIYNWDRFAKEGPTIALQADFDFGKGVDTTFFNPMVFYLPGTGRSVVKYPQVTWSTFQLPEDDAARMVCVLPEKKVAVYTPEAFAKIDREELRGMKKPAYMFEMKVNQKPLASAGQLRMAMGM